MNKKMQRAGRGLCLGIGMSRVGVARMGGKYEYGNAVVGNGGRSSSESGSGKGRRLVRRTELNRSASMSLLFIGSCEDDGG